MEGLEERADKDKIHLSGRDRPTSPGVAVSKRMDPQMAGVGMDAITEIECQDRTGPGIREHSSNGRSCRERELPPNSSSFASMTR
jgi:hypothetical protein